MKGWKDKFMYFFGSRPRRCCNLHWRSFLVALSPALMFCVQMHVQFSKMRPKLAALFSWVSFFQGSFHLEEKGHSWERLAVEAQVGRIGFLWKGVLEGRKILRWWGQGGREGGLQRWARVIRCVVRAKAWGQPLGFHSFQWLLILDVARKGHSFTFL